MASPYFCLSTNMIPQIKYDVYLSFRGEDTRYNFTSHLHAALCRKQIDTYIDYQLQKGDEISPSLLNAIAASEILVIVFSKGYASSSWCLDELVKIIECKNKYERIVIPVFYNVDPSNVRNQNGIFGDALAKLEERFKERLEFEKLERWRSALREAASISGSHSHGIRSESELIEEIVDDILKRLNAISPIDDNDQLVGAESCIKEIESLLGTSSKDIYTLGIWGIGGIGKTTIANAVFRKICSHFDGCCFIQNVKEESEKRGLVCLQRELLSKLLEGENVKIDISYTSFNFRRLSRKKVLIALDDVTHFEQIKTLIGGLKFALGSRIIITTRDRHVLNIYEVDEIYEMKKLTYDDALKLFSRHAFRKNNSDVGFEELSDEVIEYAQGIPLALEVLGCFLITKSKEEWRSAINRLRRIPDRNIQKVLRLSYDSLNDIEKNIFLDIACFFNGENEDLVIKFLDASGFFAKIGIKVLVDKSLIFILDNMIRMHNLLQEMGREIVRQESIEYPGKRSRLWHHEDIYQVLTHNTGTKTIEGISLDMSKIKEIHLNPLTFTKLPRLRFLRLYGGNKCKVSHFQGKAFTKVRYFQWDGYPSKSLPLSIHAEKIVSLIMPDSSVEQLWNDTQNLVHLKKIILNGSKQLTKLPDLSLATNIETLGLENCTSLIEFPKISSCNIQLLQLTNCRKLESLPRSLCYKLKSLTFLNLDGCSSLQRLPDELRNLESLKVLYAAGSAIRELPSSIVCLKNLKTLCFERCKGDEQMGFLFPIISLPLDGLHSLTFLSLIDHGITELPESLGQLSSLEELYLDKNNFERLPATIVHLSNLECLGISFCERLQCLPELPCNIIDMDAHGCSSLEGLSGLSICFTPLSSYEAQNIDLSNCLKLEPAELNQIIKDASQKIQLKASACRKEQGEKHNRTARGQVCFLGSEIPEWFSIQSMGSSIILKFPRGLFNNKFMGFALCAVVSFQDHHENEEFFCVRCQLKHKTKEGPLYNVGSIRKVGSDHIILGYDFGDNFDHLECYYSNEVCFQFYIVDDDGKRIECCVVRKCGIHLFYAQEYRSRSSSFDGAEEPDPKRFKLGYF